MATPTFQDLMNFAIATGGNNQITDLNSPTARNAMAAAINAEARRQLAQQAGKSAVREAQELQRMSQQETTRALPGGVTSSTLPDGYTVLTDAQGKIIGTNRPLSSVVPYAGETVEQARAAINRGESTVADRERLGEALRQSIFQQAPARPLSTETAEITPPISDLIGRKAAGLPPKASTRDIPSEASELARERLSDPLDKNQLAAIQSQIDMGNELRQLQQEIAADDQLGQSTTYTAGLMGASPLAGYGRPQRMSQDSRIAKLNRIKEIEQTLKTLQPEDGSTAAPMETPSQVTGPSSLMSMSRYLRDAYQNAMEAAPMETPSQVTGPSSLMSMSRYLRDAYQNAASAAQQQANIDELLSAIATEFNPTSERLSRERNDDLLRAIGLQHNAASEQLRNARENALIEKQREWNTSRSPADRVRIWEEIQALQNSLGIPNQSASR
jgi:hypothetical protein